jgi:hypothetical protein
MVSSSVNQPLSDVPMFFIIGRPRSGTTMLRLLFEAHPHVTIPPESPFILSLYKKYGKITDWNDSVIKEYCDDVFKQRYFEKWLITKDELLSHLMELTGENTYQTMVKKTCLAYQSVYEKQGIRLIGDKNPAYALYISRIHRIFPEAKIIHITRDYRDNYLSLINVNFEVSEKENQNNFGLQIRKISGFSIPLLSPFKKRGTITFLFNRYMSFNMTLC